MKKADYIKAVALKTATSEPVFVHKTRGFAFFIAADRPNDSYSTMQREGDNGVWLQQVKFIKEANGFGIEKVWGTQLIRLNQIDVYAVGYQAVWEKMQAKEAANRAAHAEREIAATAARARRIRDERIVTELLPSVKELLASTGVRVSGGYSDEVTITVSASQLEGFIELLAHSVSE